jgi:ketosteroid isomerase-like protein
MISARWDDAAAAAAIAVWTKIQDTWPFRACGHRRSFATVRASKHGRTGGSGMRDARQVAEGFFDAWTGKDFERARGLLHDDVSFEGPIDSFSDAASYLASLRQLSGIVTGADKRKVFVDGDDVCVIYDLKTAPVPSSRTCEWYRVRDGRIASVSVIFDARPFAPLFGAQHGG